MPLVTPALLGSAFALTYAVAAGPLLATGTVVFSALATSAFFAVSGALGGLLLEARAASHVGTVLSACALAAMTLLPWMAVRMARLPMPVIPTTADHLRDSALGVDFAATGRRATVAAEYLDGTLTGCALVAAGGAALTMATGTVFGVLYAAVALAVLMLRVRSLAGQLPRTALLAAGLAGSAVGIALAADQMPRESTLGLVALSLAGSATAVLLTVVGPRRRLSPMTGRSIDIAESLLLASVLPLAVGAIDLYSTVRHW